MGRTNTVLLVLVFAALLTKETLASQHHVGGSQGWEQSTDLNSWASAQKFKVGDQLGKLLVTSSLDKTSVYGN